MSTPVLHLLAGPNGSGKSTFVRLVLTPVTHLPFINADEIAARRWPGEEESHAYDASTAAASERQEALHGRKSFITETVFSHPSKLELMRAAKAAGYLVTMHVMLVPEDVTVMRVDFRVATGGHSVPENKIRERYKRLWALIAEARSVADHTHFYDNSTAAQAFRVVAHFDRLRLVGEASWPLWVPGELTRVSGTAG